jgi:hypothetical protein
MIFLKKIINIINVKLITSMTVQREGYLQSDLRILGNRKKPRVSVRYRRSGTFDLYQFSWMDQ